MLEVRNLSAGYGRQAVIRDVNLTVGASEIVALIGANGAGKSTLAKTLSGVLPTLAGTILLEGESIAALLPGGRLARGLALVPEGRQVFGSLTVGQNLELGAYLRKREVPERLAAVWARFPLLRQRDGDAAANLSGGQQQMLAIGRALMSGPRLLILDEPSLGLSPLLIREMFELIAGMRAQGLAILLSEQNARMSLAIADRGYVMENGRIVMSGSGAELVASGEVAARYLGLGVRERSDRPLERRLRAALEEISRWRSTASGVLHEP